LELAIKATYLYKFAGFVQWPAETFESEKSPIRLCVIGRDPFGTLLPRAVEGQVLNDRPFSIQYLPVVMPNARCHIAYIAGSPRQAMGDILDMLKDRPVLTVTDGLRRMPAGSVINFVVVDQHVRFEIDPRPAARKGLSISAKLMDVAVEVHGGGR